MKGVGNRLEALLSQQMGCTTSINQVRGNIIVEFRRFVPSTLIEGVIASTTSFEVIIHIPSEHDYHYLISDNIKELVFYLYVSKQYCSKEVVSFTIVKTVLLQIDIRKQNLLDNLQSKKMRKVKLLS